MPSKRAHCRGGTPVALPAGRHPCLRTRDPTDSFPGAFRPRLFVARCCVCPRERFTVRSTQRLRGESGHVLLGHFHSPMLPLSDGARWRRRKGASAPINGAEGQATACVSSLGSFAGRWRGSTSEKVVRPGLESTSILPSMSAASCCARERPRPLPDATVPSIR